MSNEIVGAGSGRQVPITRRRAIGAGTLFLGAGLLGTTTPPVVAAEPIALATVVNAVDLAEECQRLSIAARAAMDAVIEAGERLEAEIGRDAMKRVSQYTDEIYSQQYETWQDLVLAEVCRHLPGVAPAIRVVVHHIYEGNAEERGTCCSEGSLIGSAS